MTVIVLFAIVANWLRSSFKVETRDSEEFSDRQGCGCRLSSFIQQGLMVPGDSWGTLLLFELHRNNLHAALPRLIIKRGKK